MAVTWFFRELYMINMNYRSRELVGANLCTSSNTPIFPCKKNLRTMYEQCMGHMWLRRLSWIWAIVFPQNINMWTTLWEKKIRHERGHDMGNSVANIRLRRRSHILPIYCTDVGSVANILPIYCPYYCKYMGHEIIFGLVATDILLRIRNELRNPILSIPK